MISRASEEILYAAKNTIAADIPAILATMQTEAGDNIPLPDFKIYGLGYNVEAKAKYPVILFHQAEVEIEESGQNAMSYNFDIEAVIACDDTDPEKLTKKIMRYAEAVREVVQRNSSLTNACHYAKVTRVQYYSGEARQLAIAVITINIFIEIA